MKLSDRPEFAVTQSVGVRLGVVERLIADVARGLAGALLDLLEVGSYEGGSALAFSAAIGRHGVGGGRVLCVDPWAPYLPPEDVASNEVCRRMQEDLANGLVFERFHRNLAFADPAAPIDFRVGTLAGVLERGLLDPAQRFDLVYVDGSHAHADVRADLAAAVGLVKLGGILCGDDLERQLDEVDGDFTRANAHREFVGGYHPGVTLAVGEAFGRVWCEESVWAVRKITEERWAEPW